MGVEVFREPLYRRYYAPINSYAFLHTVFMIFLVIFLPLIIAYNSTNFWIKEKEVYEQPEISYRYEAIFVFSGRNTDGPLQYYWSSISILNELNAVYLNPAILTSAVLDDNLDGAMDRLEVNVLMGVPAGAAISSLSAMLFHNAKLEEKGKYAFDTVSYANYQSILPIRTVTIDSDMIFRQTWPLQVTGGFQNPYEDEPLLDLTNKYFQASDADFNTVMKKSIARNFSFVTQVNYCAVEAAVVGSDGLQYAVDNLNTTLIFRIPKQTIRYSPAVSEVLKYSWIQYMSFFIIIAFLLHRLNAFIFSHQLIYAHAATDVVLGKTL
jgi:transmembrane protein 231